MIMFLSCTMSAHSYIIIICMGLAPKQSRKRLINIYKHLCRGDREEDETNIIKCWQLESGWRRYGIWVDLKLFPKK